MEKPFDFLTIPLVEQWVDTQGERFLFIYGENDPWSAGAFEVSEHNDSFRFFVPGGNHNASITQPPEPALSFALDKLQQWMGVPVIRSAQLRAHMARSGALPFDHALPEERFPR